MGTRGAYGYRIGGVDKVAYNHWDSYPDYLGRQILQYIAEHSVESITEVASNITLVDGELPAPKDLQEKYKERANLDVDTGEMSNWYCLLRDCQGDLSTFHDGVSHMIDARSFLDDSLFCEWAYIINLDDGCLEVYQGFNKNPKADGRYANSKPGRSGYVGVKLIKRIPLGTITLDSFNGIADELDKIDRED